MDKIAKGLYVKVEYADSDITAQLERYLTNLTYTDYLDGKTPDTLKVTLEDSQGLFQGQFYPVKGSALYFEFGYDTNEVFKSGKGFLIDAITVNGGNNSGGGGSTADAVEWTACANLPSHGIHSKATKAWTDTTLEGIAREISKKHKMDLVFECKKTISLKRFTQFEQTDLKTINELTRKYGLLFSIKAGKDRATMVIADLDTLRSKPPLLKLFKSDCTSYSFSDSAERNTKGRYVRYFDSVKKELVEFDSERLKTKQADGLTDSMLDTLEGQGQQDIAIEREALEVYAQKDDPKDYERTARISLPGNPNLLAGVVLELPEDEWLYNAGKWVITESQHVITVSGGYKTTLALKIYKR